MAVKVLLPGNCESNLVKQHPQCKATAFAEFLRPSSNEKPSGKGGSPEMSLRRDQSGLMGQQNTDETFLISS